MKNYKKVNLYINIISGIDKMIPTESGNLVKELNFDNSATTPPL